MVTIIPLQEKDH